jgi:fructuronate reductase
MRYVTGFDELGRKIDVSDPLSLRFKAIAEKAAGDPAALVDGFLSTKEVFGTDLPLNKTFRANLINHLAVLYAVGAREAVRNVVGQVSLSPPHGSR